MALPIIVVLCTFLVDLPRTAHVAFELATVVVVFPLVTILSVQAETPGPLIKPFLLLGLTSYAAYALHRPVLSVINGVAQVAHFDMGRYAPLIGIPFLLLFLAGCWFVDLAYDRPVRRRLQRGRLRRAAALGSGVNG